jgi:predicted nucleic acid-binding protein
MRILLDTSAYSEWKRGNREVDALVRRSSAVLLSTIVAGELLFGFRRGKRFRENLLELERFLENPYVHVVQVTLETADRFARIASGLREKGTPIPTNDIWVAAHAMEEGARLISPDRHFDSVEGLAWVPVPPA